MGAAYGLLQETARGRPQLMGPLIGSRRLGELLSQLVPMGLYQPPWRYSATMLANDLGYHLTCGVAVASAYASIDDR